MPLMNIKLFYTYICSLLIMGCIYQYNHWNVIDARHGKCLKQLG